MRPEQIVVNSNDQKAPPCLFDGVLDANELDARCCFDVEENVWPNAITSPRFAPAISAIFVQNESGRSSVQYSTRITVGRSACVISQG